MSVSRAVEWRAAPARERVRSPTIASARRAALIRIKRRAPAHAAGRADVHRNGGGVRVRRRERACALASFRR
ncbi:hypothetical protein LV178_28440, partial [Burkholderia mallei]|nr:hypothetical protein [Burkholderia mallei]